MLLFLRPWWTSNQALVSLRWLNCFEKSSSSFEQKEASISLDFFWWKKVSYLFKISKSTLSRIFFLFSIFTLKPNFIISLKETWIGEKKSSGLTFYFPLRWYNFGSKGFPREDLKTKHKGFLFFQLLIKISVGVFHLLMFIKTPFPSAFHSLFILGEIISCKVGPLGKNFKSPTFNFKLWAKKLWFKIPFQELFVTFFSRLRLAGKGTLGWEPKAVARAI